MIYIRHTHATYLRRQSMRLYAGRTSEFVEYATRNNIAVRLQNAFIDHFRYRPSPGEIRSWEESLLRLSLVVRSAGLHDHGIFLEYQLPLTSRRLDAMLTGNDDDGHENAVIVELKQWQDSSDCDADSLVTTRLGGDLRDTLHPCVQVAQYRDYLADMHTAFHEGENPIQLSACAYLHNYRADADDAIRASKFSHLFSKTPLYDAAQSAELEHFLIERLRGGAGLPVLEKIEQGSVRPSKQLLQHVNAVIAGEPRFVLLDEQRVVFERALAEAKHGFSDSRKRVLLVQGGPGTGKSVLAINLLAALSHANLHAQYATGSRAFTQTLRKIVGIRAGAQFTYFNSYTDADKNSIDVLICDEAHRIREKSSSRFTPAAQRALLRPQIDELLHAAKVTIFFIDDRQIVRPGEIGSGELIRTKAQEAGADVREYRLEAQFRCAGSDAFVNWVDNTLGIQPTANQVWNAKRESFDFRVYRTVEALDQAIRARANAGASARLAAGFCWPWSDPRQDGTLVDDVVVGNFRRAWNAKPEAKRLARGIPKASLWAYDAGGMEQVGCIYTAQGFEFDYVGVIWGKDLRYDPLKQDWTADRSQSEDTVVKRSGDAFRALVRNTYRVLLTRGLKGCYVFCEDEETAKFLLNRTEGLGFEGDVARDAQAPAQPASFLPLTRVPLGARRPFQNCIPVYDLKIAAGQFGEFQLADQHDIEWVEPPSGRRAAPDLFVAQVAGESMNRHIPNGAWCLFRMNPAGTRNGKIVLAQLRNYSDPETGGAFTIKRYESTKDPTGETGNVSIRLKPESSVAHYEAIELTPDDDRVRVIAEMVEVIR